MNQTRLRGQTQAMALSPLNQSLLSLWLELAGSGQIPAVERFDPAGLGDALRGCALFDVIIGEAVICRRMGSVLRAVYGPDVIGVDILGFTPAPQRRQRMIRFSAVAQGAIGLGRRTLSNLAGRKPGQAEELMLPLGGVRPGEPVPVLLHTDWRPNGVDRAMDQLGGVIPLADEFVLLGLD